jgi:hypothetical protein
MTPDNGTRQNNVYRLRLPLSRFRDAVPPAEKATARQDQARQAECLSNDSNGCSDFFHAGTGAFRGEVGTVHTAGSSGRNALISARANYERRGLAVNGRQGKTRPIQGE